MESREYYEQKVYELGTSFQRSWYHCIELPFGVKTSTDPRPLPFYDVLKRDNVFDPLTQYAGCKVLDLGCADGFWTLEFAKHGAQVKAIDSGAMDGVVERFRFVMDTYGVWDRVEFVQADVLGVDFDVNEYDLVLFLCLYHHLSSPEATRSVLWRIFKSLKPNGVVLIEGAASETMVRTLENIGFTVTWNCVWPVEGTRQAWKAVKSYLTAEQVRQVLQDLQLFYNCHEEYIKQRQQGADWNAFLDKYGQALANIKPAFVKAYAFWIAMAEWWAEYEIVVEDDDKKWVIDYAKLHVGLIPRLRMRLEDLLHAKETSDLVIAIDNAVSEFHIDKPMLSHIGDYLRKSLTSQGWGEREAKETVDPIVVMMNEIYKSREEASKA